MCQTDCCSGNVRRVDSSVTCMLLAEQGFDVFGITMKILGAPATPLHTACAPPIEHEAREICRKLGVPHHTVDLTEEFEAEIITPFIESYSRGTTPNPCVLCNAKFKFGYLLNKAMELGADYLATGHYARAGRIPEHTGEFIENHVMAATTAANADAATGTDRAGAESRDAAVASAGQAGAVAEASMADPGRGQRHLLARGLDPGKDQSYVLYRLNQDMLAHAMFPLGSFTKKQVTGLSRRRGLLAAEKPESQEICFVGGAGWNSYRELLRERNAEARPGLIVDTSGRVLGRHQGLAYYTVGQRRGLGVSAPYSLYVVGLVPEANQVIVGKREEAYAKGCYIDDVNFIMSDYPEAPVRGSCMVRYRGKEVNATLIPGREGRPDGGKDGVLGDSSGKGPGLRNGVVLVKFDEPQFAVTPGQSLVFYQGDLVYGGGIIIEPVR